MIVRCHDPQRQPHADDHTVAANCSCSQLVVHAAAGGGAARGAYKQSDCTEARVRRAYLLMFARPATDEEVKLLSSSSLPRAKRLAAYAQVLLG